MSKLLGVILIFLMAAVGGEVYFLTQLPKKSPPSSTTISPAKPNRPTASPSFKTIYREANDKEGRTVVYQTGLKGSFPGYQGEGYQVALLLLSLAEQ